MWTPAVVAVSDQTNVFSSSGFSGPTAHVLTYAVTPPLGFKSMTVLTSTATAPSYEVSTWYEELLKRQGFLVARTTDGKQRDVLQAWLSRLVQALHGRTHAFNVSVAHVWAEQQRQLDKAGTRMPLEASYIAATARRHGLTIVTGNDRHFRRPGLKVFNPFKELP